MGDSDSQNDEFWIFEEFDIIQFPLNIFDQETFAESFLKRLKRKKNIDGKKYTLQGLDELSILFIRLFTSQIKNLKQKQITQQSCLNWL